MDNQATQNPARGISSRMILASPHEHCPPLGIERALDSGEHLSSHREPPVQLTEHWPVQVTWHVEPSVQETLLLAPTVTVHSDELPQWILHDSSQLPEQSFSLLQSREQLA